jgi:phosphoserine phosphatase
LVRSMTTRKTIDLICFDVDGTLVEHPAGMVIWEVLNLRYGGSHAMNKHRYGMYHRGEITYDEWVALDVEGWVAAGATRDEILESVSEFRLVERARETVDELKRRGYELAIISGTLDVVLDTLFPEHPFDDVYTNKIFFDEDGKLTSWKATAFDGKGKPHALRKITERHGIPMSRSAFVGDGENDVPLLGMPGVLVAYEPRSKKLEDGADHVIRNRGFDTLLKIFE